uniref:Uncharacterized protein n=1 Tax=Anguilla anguilla TaxID=7936 RepID=A0A0E9QIY8_ANGAN
MSATTPPWSAYSHSEIL